MKVLHRLAALAFVGGVATLVAYVLLKTWLKTWMPTSTLTFVLVLAGPLLGLSISFITIRVERTDGRWELKLEKLGQSGKPALRLLDAWGAILPIRIAKEELGDYLEDIGRRADEGQCWLLWLRVITAIVWTGINAVGFVSKNLLGKEAETRSDKQTSK